MRGRRLLALSACLAISTVAFAGPDEDRDRDARQYYYEGVAALEAGKASAARLLLERAYELRQTLQIAFALGRAEFDMGLFADAAMHMAPYIRQFPNASREERKAFARVEKMVAHLRLVVNVDRADIAVDGVVIGSSPVVFQPIYVLAGRRTIRVTCDGFRPVEQTYDVVAGEETAVSFVLERTDDPLSLTDAGVQPRDAERPARPAVWDGAAPLPSASVLPSPKFRIDTRTAVLGSGAVLTLVAGIIAVAENARAASASSEVDGLRQSSRDACTDGGSSSCRQVQDAVDRYNSAAGIARGALVTAAVLGGATTAAWFFWPSSRLRATPVANGVIVTGEF